MSLSQQTALAATDMIVVATMSSPALPEEIWVEIIAQLPHAALRTTVERLNRSFRALLTQPALAGLTFRAPPDVGNVQMLMDSGGVPAVHPLFARLRRRTGTPYDDVRVVVPWSCPVALSELAACRDMVTFPAVNRVIVCVADSEDFLPRHVLRNSEGVTVAGVVKALCRDLSEEVPAFMCKFCEDLHLVCEVGDTPELNVAYDVLVWGEDVDVGVSEVKCLVRDEEYLLCFTLH